MMGSMMAKILGSIVVKFAYCRDAFWACLLAEYLIRSKKHTHCGE